VAKLEFTGRRIFKPYITRSERFAIMVAHRRCGKTVACVQDLLSKAMGLQIAEKRTAPGRYAYVGPYLSQAKEVAWEYLKRLGGPVIVNKNEGELWADLVTGSRIRIHGADNPDRLRGGYLDGIVLDEYADMRPSIFPAVIRPMLADYEGWATFIGTPKGRNEFHRKWVEALADPSWFTGMYKASETKLLAADELAAIARDLTPEEYDQEMECSFDAAIRGAYYGKLIAAAEHAGRICEVPSVLSVPVQCAWDLGIGDSTAIWVFQCIGSEIRILDAFENSGFGLEWYVEELSKRGWGNPEIRHWLPHDAKVRELSTGRSRVEFLVGLGLKCDLVPNLGLDDGINAVRIMLSQCFFNRGQTDDGVEALRQYRTEYNEKTKAYTDKPRHDWTSHYADAFRYLCIVAREQARPERDKPKPIGVSLPELTIDEFMDIEDKQTEDGRV
jgi:phage terminase large subunit